MKIPFFINLPGFPITYHNFDLIHIIFVFFGPVLLSEPLIFQSNFRFLTHQG